MGQFYVKENLWISRIFELCMKEPVIGLDIETYPLPEYKHIEKAALDPHMNAIRSVQISTPEHDWFIDLHYVTDIRLLKILFSSEKVAKAIQNATFETRCFLKHWDIFPENVFDTLIASRLFQPAFTPQIKHKLGDITERYLSVHMDKNEQLSDWSGELTKSQIQYGWNDSRRVLELVPVLTEKLRETGMLWPFKIECDAVLPCAEMELNGVDVDLIALSRIQKVMEQRLAELKEEAKFLLPHKIFGLLEQESAELDSPIQLKNALNSQYNLGLESTDGQELVQHRYKYPKLIDCLLDYSSLEHNINTYCKPILKHIHPVTKRLQPAYKQLRQWQHRATIANPNLNLPRPNSFGPGVKDPIFVKNFHFDVSFRDTITPATGNLFSIVDLSGNQARIVADTFMANEPTMKEEFALGALADIYRRTAAEILKKLKTAVSKEERQRAKTWVLSFLFGAGAKRYMEQKLKDTRIPSSIYQCRKERTAFFGVFKTLASWHQNSFEDALSKGYVETPTGRKIYIPEEFCSMNRAANFGVCATEKDGTALAGGRLSRELRKQNIKAWPAIWVYDEFVLEGSPSAVEKAYPIHSRIMKNSMDEILQDVPAAVEGGIGPTWGSKK